MTITIETNHRGQVEILGENVRGQKHVLMADSIFVCSSNGHVLLKESTTFVLRRPNPHEVPMIAAYFRETDGPHAPVVFAGEPPRG